MVTIRQCNELYKRIRRVIKVNYLVVDYLIKQLLSLIFLCVEFIILMHSVLYTPNLHILLMLSNTC